ncbi:MAG: Crp/Fnr family transcriptional regulator [Rhizobacter sp.]|nr:Crp/Fnr family transcriptional regulator [Rhizobacter sp.]
MSRFIDPLGNHLIAALSAADSRRWADELEWTDMPLGTVLYESGSTMEYVYFPVTSIVSLLYITEGGASSEIAVVGNEGMVGVSLFMGGGSTPSRGVVQCAGEGFRMKAHALKSSFDGSPEVQLLLLKYTQSLLTQMSQTAVCNRHHSLEAQLCKRLLLSLDRLSSPAMMMTQELIANMLGVRREGVSVAAFRLQRDGLIRYARGCIEVLDRPGLERRACECYGVVKRECSRLLPEAASNADAPRARVAMRLPDAALDSVLASCARAAQRASREPGRPAVAARMKPEASPRNFEDARTPRRTGDSRTRASLAGVEAFLAMSTIMSRKTGQVVDRSVDCP